MHRKRVGIVIYEEVEVLDFCGPFEVFSVTRANEEKRRDEASPFLAGISAGIDMSLKVVEQYLGETIARATARHMEYPYPDADGRRIRL